MIAEKCMVNVEQLGFFLQSWRVHDEAERLERNSSENIGEGHQKLQPPGTHVASSNWHHWYRIPWP